MGIQNFLGGFLIFINGAVIPLLIAVAFLFFIWNAARYFIIQGDSDEGRTKARRLALYGIGAFVVIVSLWGIVNLLVSSLGFNQQNSILPDYILQNRDPWQGLREGDVNNNSDVPTPKPRPNCFMFNGEQVCN